MYCVLLAVPATISLPPITGTLIPGFPTVWYTLVCHHFCNVEAFHSTHHHPCDVNYCVSVVKIGNMLSPSSMSAPHISRSVVWHLKI